MEHIPVLLAEVLQQLALQPRARVIDATLGRGGYAEAILERIPEGRLVALDRDATAIAESRERLKRFEEKVSFHQVSYSEIATAARECVPADDIVADLGASRPQFDDPERGFSFREDGPLDMRMDQSQELTADTVVNHWDETLLADTIYKFGEEPKSRRIAKAICQSRPLRGTRQLAEVVERAAPFFYPKKGKVKRIHPATRVFQAIRIAVNNEIGELEQFLDSAPRLLAPGGRLAIVSFHSLEDRPVKWAFRRLEAQGFLNILTKRPVTPSEEEREANPASRSAKLRVAERSEQPWQ